MKIFFNLGTGNLRRSRKIDDFTAFFFQEIKLSLPVVAHYECVNVVFLYVAYLLIPAGFGDNQINVADSFKKLLSYLVAEIALLLLFVPVELIC